MGAGCVCQDGAVIPLERGNVCSRLFRGPRSLDLKDNPANTDVIAQALDLFVPNRFLLRVAKMKLKLAVCVVGIGVCLLGCTPKEPNAKPTGRTALKQEEGPKTLPEAMKQLAGHAETISKAFTSNKPDDAHHSLHDVGHLLECLPDLANDLAEEKRDVVKKSVAELFECFGALDDAMHQGAETPYSKVGDRITAAMAGLKSATE